MYVPGNSTDGCVCVNMRLRSNISHVHPGTVRWGGPSEDSYGSGDGLEYGGGLDARLDSLPMMIKSPSGKLSSVVASTATVRFTAANLMAWGTSHGQIQHKP